MNKIIKRVRSQDANSHGAALIFPGCAGAPIGPDTIRDLYVRAGYGGRHVPHGWRASFSTILTEHLPEDCGEIDRALGHVGCGRVEEDMSINRKVEGTCNRAQHIAVRQRLFET